MDNEIMNKFNETFGDKPEEPVEPYHSVQNQQILSEQNIINNNFNNMPNTNVEGTNFVNQTPIINMVPEVNNTIVNANNEQLNSNNNQQLYDTTNYIGNKPLEKKTKKNTIKINPELKTAILLVIILLIVMSLVPVLFDLYDELRIKIFSR